MRHPNLLRKGDTLLVVVDIQTKLLNVMFDKQLLVGNCRKLIQACKLMETPIVVTEQYPKGMGPTDPRILELIQGEGTVEKLSFSCCGVDNFNQRVSAFGKKQMVVIGIEAHVCILQTVHDLLHRGYSVYVPYDAVSSRKESDCRNALERMSQAGAVVGSVESAVFELMERADTQSFKEISRLIK